MLVCIVKFCGFQLTPKNLREFYPNFEESLVCLAEISRRNLQHLTGLNSFTVDVVIVAVLKILRRNVASCVYVEIATFREFYESRPNRKVLSKFDLELILQPVEVLSVALAEDRFDFLLNNMLPGRVDRPKPEQ